jgi:hypothetical protein
MSNRHKQLHDERMARIQREIDAADARMSVPTVAQLQAELDDLRGQLAQADSYGAYMRHAPHPIPFAEWLARRAARWQAAADTRTVQP